MLEIDLAKLVLTTLGFVPVQVLRSRRAAIVAAAIGIAAFAGTLIATFLLPGSSNDILELGDALIALAILSFSYGIVCGALTRFAVLMWPGLPRAVRWSIPIVVLVAAVASALMYL